MLDPVFSAVTRFTTQRRRLVVLLLILFTALAVRWWPYFQFQPDVSKMLPAGNDIVRLSELLEEQTANGRMLLIDVVGEGLDDRRLRSLVRRLEGGPARRLYDDYNQRLARGDPADFEELCAANPEHSDELRRLDEFGPSIEEVHATREDFIGDNWPLIREAPLSFMPIEGLEVLADRLTGSDRDEALAERRRTVAGKSAFGLAEYLMDPLGLSDLLQEQVTASVPLELRSGSPFFVTADGTRAILRVKGRLDSMDVDFSRVLLDEINAALEEEVPEGSWEFYGEYARSQENLSRIRQDLRKSLILSAILVTVFLMLSMRRLVDPTLVFVPVMLAVCWTLPYGGFFLGPLTPLTISAAASRRVR